MKHANFHYLSVGVIAVLLLVYSCSELNDDSIYSPIKFATNNTPQALSILNSQCATCHSGAEPAGNYDVSTLIGIFGTGTDNIPNAIPGESGSLILQTIQSGGSMTEYIGSQANADELTTWIVSNRLGLNISTAHPEGWQNPNDAINFHGAYLKDNNWDLDACKSCHGENYDVVFEDKSCVSCHVESPESCNTCHGASFKNSGAPPGSVAGDVMTSIRGVGAHQTHITGGVYTGPIACSECHNVPATLKAEGHIDQSPNAELSWGPLATLGGVTPEFTAELTCKNTYCHGAFAGGRQNYEVKWTVVDGKQTACGTCHKLLPDQPSRNFGFVHTPANINCSLCHGSVVDKDFNIIDKSKHINGEIDALAKK